MFHCFDPLLGHRHRPKQNTGQATTESICTVCLSEMKRKDKIRTLPKCRHSFHSHCINKWFRSNSTCPICRSNIYVDSNKDNGEEATRVIDDDRRTSSFVGPNDIYCDDGMLNIDAELAFMLQSDFPPETTMHGHTTVLQPFEGYAGAGPSRCHHYCGD